LQRGRLALSGPSARLRDQEATVMSLYL
jgi:hypothetical protein